MTNECEFYVDLHLNSYVDITIDTLYLWTNENDCGYPEAVRMSIPGTNIIEKMNNELRRIKLIDSLPIGGSDIKVMLRRY